MYLQKQRSVSDENLYGRHVEENHAKCGEEKGTTPVEIEDNNVFLLDLVFNHTLSFRCVIQG